MTELKKITDERLGDSYYEIDHPSGLRIYVYPKPEYSSAYAIFGARCGSMDTRFRLKGEEQWTEIPAGIAHFLEHKLFESEDGDAFSRYAVTGASANAYTSFDCTCYLFSCTDRFQDSLEILLDFVQSPYFTEATVQKEQGIIGQEIRMYDDAPDWRLLFNLLCAMYHNHPVRIDIAGTVESISEITADLLYKCYHTFYNLHNMTLAVAGNTTVEEVLEVADRMLKKAPDAVIERSFDEEPDSVVQSYTEQRLAVSLPLFMLGFKEPCRREDKSTEEVVEANLLLELIAGKTSPLYRRLMEQGLINDSFGTEYFEGSGYAASLFTGETRDPKAVRDEILREIVRLRETGIDSAAFERAKRRYYGRAVMSFNSVENIANSLAACHFTGRSLFEESGCVARMTKQRLEQRLQDTLRDDQAVLSAILPPENKGGNQK